MSKIDKAIEMVKYAIKRGIRFDYLLIDSWQKNVPTCQRAISFFSFKE